MLDATRVAVQERRTTVGLISCQRLFREALRSLLRGACNVEVTLVDDVTSVGRALAGPPRLDVALLDVAGFDDGASTLFAQLGPPSARPPVVLLVDHADPETVRAAMHAGVEGILDRESSAESFVMTVQQVLIGQSVFPGPVSTTNGHGRADDLGPLSRRQREVLGLLADGRSNSEIARELFISVNTVKFHLRQIFHELGLHNRVQAARYFADVRTRSA